MTAPEQALSGTTYLSPARRTAFYDYYQRQYAQTLAWVQQALTTAATARNQQRCHGAADQRAQRQRLALYSGVDQCFGPATQVEQRPTPSGAIAYRLQNAHGLWYTGLSWEPAAELHGVVILAGPDESTTVQLVAHYLAQGLRVICPCLARPCHSFQDHPQRRWYYFTDDELLHLFFFICGGSLAGLEAAELLTVAQALGQQAGRTLPVALHLADRHLLTGAVAAALAPMMAAAGVRPYHLLILPDTIAQLDHQETDVRVNTVWNFHSEFDALTLLTLASDANVLFIESTPTPSLHFGQALAWFTESGQTERAVQRLVTPTVAQLAVAVAQLLMPAGRSLNQQPIVASNLESATAAELYQEALARKIAYLEGLQETARQKRQTRYALAGLTPDEYRARVAESLARVAGSPLPEATVRNPQTRLVERGPVYDLYEVILSSVPGVEVAGYLLMPLTTQPAPAIICQHGLGGRPEALVGIQDRLEGHQWVYDRFAQRLAERGYITFVPFMNWGWAATAMRDRLVKHAYALGFAPNRFEVAQLHAIVDFLQARPEVMATRIAFYGLSYGGHASLWLCAHEPRLAAVVTAGHFNEWQTKLLNPELSPPLVRPTAYVTVDEGYDMFNYNVLNEVGHAELATRFAPRPQMIENGLQDTVTPTAWVNREFARTQAVFTWLNAPDQLQLEHFPGPHRVWAEGSFRFLEHYLRPSATT